MFDLDQLLMNAIAHGASDIHIKPGHSPFFRINSALREVQTDPVHPQALMDAIQRMLPAHLVEQYREQHEADFAYTVIGGGRFRVNAYMAQGLPVLSLRNVKTEIPTFEQLNLPPVLETIAAVQRGIIIISGTTSSGKSTTLAAIMEYINQRTRRRIVTVEDPVEYLFTDKLSVITQREVGLDTSSFEQALKHVLRQDPDVIVIGEMRDPRSLKTALSAAETGHLVLTTLHAATAPVSITRMIDLLPGDEGESARLNLASTLQAVICQRLVPCIQGGVIPAVEVMLNTAVIKHALQQNKLDVLPEAIEASEQDGMQSFNQAVHHLIKAGKITEDEGLKYVTNPAALRRDLSGIQSKPRRILMR